ncbi:hypothetical protein ACOTCS_24725 [Achromobacter xylosoxidans]
MTITHRSGRLTPGRHEPRFEYPSTARAARQAARAWFEAAPDASPARFRDLKFIEHCKGKFDTSLERRIRQDAFKQAFAEAIGHIVVEEGRLFEAPA